MKEEKVTERQCWLFHDWGKWEVKEHGTILDQKTKAVLGTTVTQRRNCKSCNLLELRMENVRL